MASKTIEISAPTGLSSPVLKLFTFGGDTIQNGSGSGNTLTEKTNDKGRYTCTNTDALSGKYRAVVHLASSTTPVFEGVLDIVDSVGTYYVMDGVRADAREFGGTAGTFSGGRPEVNATHLSGQSLAANNATLYLKQLNIVNNTDSCVTLSSAGSGLNTVNIAANGPNCYAVYMSAAGANSDALYCFSDNYGAVFAGAEQGLLVAGGMTAGTITGSLSGSVGSVLSGGGLTSDQQAQLDSIQDHTDLIGTAKINVVSNYNIANSELTLKQGDTYIADQPIVINKPTGAVWPSDLYSNSAWIVTLHGNVVDTAEKAAAAVKGEGITLSKAITKDSATQVSIETLTHSDTAGLWAGLPGKQGVWNYEIEARKTGSPDVVVTLLVGSMRVVRDVSGA